MFHIYSFALEVTNRILMGECACLFDQNLKNVGLIPITHSEFLNLSNAFRHGFARLRHDNYGLYFLSNIK